MSRISKCFATLKQKKCGAFIPYLEAHDPDYQTSLSLLKAMPKAGADIIEIGMPFSDPMADGSAVQKAAIRALKAGATMKKTLQMVTEFRMENQHTPLILMGYTNPIEYYGYEKFCQDAAKAGVDGLIIVDMPPEEIENIKPYAIKNQIDIIYLVAPTTSADRLTTILKEASGFIYYVSITGTTGTSTATNESLEKAIPMIKAASDLPIVIGFGLNTPEHTANAAKIADGAVVGSALLKTLESTLDSHNHATQDTVTKVIEHTKCLADGAHSVLKQ
ncbi:MULTISPECIES: tryptophan synthase subunit alpha [Commensalibacter]|uniref:Tryptophan synthase alpha chain n=2 Tax=Commensalibacter TaxID=1079922 RepID=W7DYU4_9PROT|nr:MULTISPECIES: tryptophan synthase subunit alpha [Commensalibacter]EUK17874.1 tryptophan synthase subunit alpha [Commensalibacter papalotli (ex Servin-Garciduenas et al. 2014)]CAI3942609.1 Tryptophan synthase alpha chain (TrpA) (PDB:6HUL) [Commensalibacter papalotli (ex Botero et al. 2024)]CAI3948357.1 Tryptophan synthase alpha chain (TrpA) (PDB:6HUL) [Commensalibacter papalotli (ex Botero et al. 2024)]